MVLVPEMKEMVDLRDADEAATDVVVRRSEKSSAMTFWQRSEGTCRGPAGGQDEVAARR